MLPKSKWRNFGELGLDPKAIIIHNTLNNMTAQLKYSEIFNTSEKIGCHFIIDSKYTLQCLPTNYKCHSINDDVNAWDYNNCISIYICDDISNNNFYEGQTKAITFIKELMSEYSIDINNIYFHIDFDERTYCPYKILDIYKTKQNWLKEEF